MKHTFAAILLLVCLHALIGCGKVKTNNLEIIETDTSSQKHNDTNVMQRYPFDDLLDKSFAEYTFSETLDIDVTDATEETEALAETEVVTPPSAVSQPSYESTWPISTKPGTAPTGSKSKQPEVHPAVPEPTQPKEETKPTKPTESAPAESESTPTEPAPTEPADPAPAESESAPTEPAPTESKGCSHDWVCIHHEEEGHWKAGIVCDCGWTVYGNTNDLINKWNTHSASYSAEEALFNHGGYGAADEWIEDEPAYDEWVCRHCGESKS